MNANETHDRTRPPVGRRGFSLVELLVVVGIIAGMIALLFPAINGVLDRANNLQCQSNLKTIGQASLTWSARNQGLLLACRFNQVRATGEQSREYWCTILAEEGYLDAPDTSVYGEANPPMALQTVLRCPSGIDLNVGWSSAASPADPRLRGYTRQYAPSGFKTDCWYYYNGHTYYTDRSPGGAVPGDGKWKSDWVTNWQGYCNHISQIKDRSTMVMACDGVAMNGTNYTFPETRLSARHTGDYGANSATNMVFYDGHVEAYQWAEDYTQDPLYGNGLTMDHPPFFRFGDQ
jgi:prepilin-type N-terminal cleavage/methylation domain-containing protein/prepilin-type processing-associated H-X9-DG protein